MIPVKLELYNFLAYRDPGPLDLTGLHVACLVGANGAGKSSLLDAITWSLWGKARTRRDDELIHGDESEMQVSLTFLLEGNCYRVTRYRSRQGSGLTKLALDVQDEDDWRYIGESTIRATQERINRILRLDYSTFINSAFLMQGRADEFTNKTAGERKAILGEILGLDAWAAYEERVKRQLRDIEQERNYLDTQIKEIDTELDREVEYQRNLIEAQEELDSLTRQVSEAQVRFGELEDARRERDTCQVRHNDFERRIAQSEAELRRIQEEKDRHLARLAEFDGLLASRVDIEAGYETLREARSREEELNERLLEQSDLHRKQSELQRAIDAARNELVAGQRELTAQRSDLERRIGEGTVEDKLRDAQDKIANLETLETACNGWREQSASLREERARLDADNRNLRVEMERIAGERDQIAATTEAVCPLCGQDLSEEHRASLLDRLEREGSEKKESWSTNREHMEGLDIELARLEREIKAAEPELRNLPPLREHMAVLAARMDGAARAEAELEPLEARLAELEAMLASGDYAQIEQAELIEVQAQLAALGYDEAEHRAVRATIEEYKDFETRQAELARALEAAPESEAAVAQLDEQAANWEQRRTEDSITLSDLAASIEKLDARLVDFEEVGRQLNQLRDKEGQARYRVGAARQKLEALGQQQVRRTQFVEQQSRLGDDFSIYDELRLAFGKDGIPAMIIEAAIPEIESEANQILSRMTDGRMNIRFDTQRAKVTGGVMETLDIRIADELGTRDYATFSGGEAFRVNFAIRLALSRLLARRAGAQLRSLIIDEGFGTQDTQGRERLVQAIRVIQDEFDLILVITHIDELREAFPARIEVTKMPGGSVIEVV